MAKFYKKSQLEFVNGYVIDPATSEAVALPDKVAEQLNDYETTVQKAQYMAGQEEGRPEPSLDGFERRSNRKRAAEIEVATPLLDAKKAESMAILEEIRTSCAADSVNEILSDYEDMIEFLRNDTFVEGSKIVMVDTPELGDPLKLTIDDAVIKLSSTALDPKGFVSTKGDED